MRAERCPASWEGPAHACIRSRVITNQLLEGWRRVARYRVARYRVASAGRAGVPSRPVAAAGRVTGAALGRPVCVRAWVTGGGRYQAYT